MAKPVYREAVELRFIGYTTNQEYVSRTKKWEVYVNVRGIPIDEDGNIIQTGVVGEKPWISKIVIRSEDEELPWNKFNQIIAKGAVEAKKAFKQLRKDFADIDEPI